MANSTEIQIIQVNLGRAFKANQSLNNFQQEEEFDISVLQEPYSLNNKIIGFPLKHKVIANNKDPKTAIIIHKENITAFPIIIEQKLIAVKINKGERELLIINCYCPPNENVERAMSAIGNILQKFIDINTIIMGDFNSKHQIWGSTETDEKGEKVLEFTVLHNLTLLNAKESPPTFKTSRARGWIDLTICDANLNQDIKSWEVLKTYNHSDHRYIKVVIKNEELPEEYGLTLKGQTKVMEKLQIDPWFEEVQGKINTKESIEEIVNTLHEKIEKLKKEFSKKKKPSKQKPNTWWSRDLEIERKRVRALRRRYQKAKGDIREQYKKEYYKEHDTYNNMIEQAKNNSWKTLCTKATKNPFILPYKIARNKMKTKVMFRSITKENGEVTKTLQETIEHILGNLYPNCMENDEPGHSQIQSSNDTINNNKQGGNWTSGAGMRERNLPSDDLPFTEIEVTQIVKNLRKDVTPGPDNLKTNLIQVMYERHKTFFVNLFNACLKHGHFPQRWKESKIILIPKGNGEDKSEENKYRPIAINSILGKILEKLIKDRIYYFLFKNHHFNKKQFGFTHGTSTTTALEEIIKRINQAKIDKLNSMLIALDIKNAFNSIKPEVVIQKLEEYKCPNNLIKLADNILRNRKIIYETDGVKIKKTLTSGSPQGSPLSPLCWNITIGDLLETQLQEGVHIQAFADDVVLHIKFRSRKEVEEKATKALTLINQWAHQKGITLNKEKSEYMIIGKQYISHQPQIKIGQDKIKMVNEMKILGVVLDTKLTFLPHLKYLKRKVDEVTYNLSRTIKDDKHTNRNTLQLIYKRGIERMVTYASPAWYSRKTIFIKKLKSIQRLPLLLITKSFKTTSNLSLNILANIPPLHLTIEKENELHYILKKGKNFTWQQKVYTENEIMKKHDQWQDHPANKVSIPFGTTEEEADFKIYTDGSKKEKETGAAFIILNKDNQIQTVKKYKLPEHSSNYEAEIIAIQKAIEHIWPLQAFVKYQLFTDSQSALLAIKNPDNLNPIICNIRKTLSQTQSKDIKLTYVKAHSGNIGNTLADECAKEASKDGEEIFVPITKTVIAKELKKKLNDEWNELWKKEGKHSYTFTWIRNTNFIPPHFPTNYYTSQAITGHGRFPFYFTRFGILQQATCYCSNIIESFDHYLQQCPIVTNERKELKRILGQNLQNRKPEIIKQKETMKILETMVEKINEAILQC